MSVCRFSATISVLLFASQIVSAQTNAAADPGAQTTVLRSTSREVLLDLVVRDKHHHMVGDLKPEEVEVYEDGVEQKILGFRGVQGTEQLQLERGLAQKEAAAASHPSTPAPPVTSLQQVNFVAIVFAEIAPLNLEFAREAVLDFLKSNNLPNTYVTIYRLNRTLTIVRTYTNDKDSLAKAVDAAIKGFHTDDGIGTQASVVGGANASVQAIAANIMGSPRTDPATAMAARNLALNPTPFIALDPLFARDAAAQDVSFTLGNAILTQAHMETGLRMATSLSNGMDTIDSLRALVRSQEKLPGRKVVLYLSDGMAFPADRRDAVENLIGYANRSAVSFYSVDTRGLSAEDPMMQSLSALERTGAASSAQKSDPVTGHKEDDDVAITAVANRQESLREVAESTGGFAVTNTNEIAVPMQRVMEDIRNHYELTYSPTATNYDGHFRKIEVKINRAHVVVQARKGYFAVPDVNGEPLQTFEMVALNAINARPASADFPYEIAFIKFRPRTEAVQYEVAFEVPVSALSAVLNPKTGKARIQASLVALIHNREGEIVGKVSREVLREMTKAELASVGKDRILYAEPVELPPGHYVVDTAVTDEQAVKTSVKRTSVFVDPGSGLGLSSLELVRELDPLKGVRNPLNPFELGNGRITPSLAESVAPGKSIDVYFVVYPMTDTAGPEPKVTLQMLRDGKEVARKLVELPKPEQDGTMPVLLRLSPEPGHCDILVTAQQGTLAAQSSLSLSIEQKLEN
jgi:VWFA-related protein